jgi:hypothetical protein
MSENFQKNGCRLDSLRVKVCRHKTGQLTATIPRQVARKAGIGKGSVLHFSIEYDYIKVVVSDECD